MSGDAFNSTHDSPSPETAIELCVRSEARIRPLRCPAQLTQLQFHCGKPPPALEPSTRIFTSKGAFARTGGQTPSRFQRFATYMVISMPNRISMACGVSHFIRQLLLMNEYR